MSNQMEMYNIDNGRSYTTEINLEKALKRLNIHDHEYVVARNRTGRWTAIFPFSQITDGNVGRYARLGFMTIG